MRKTWSLARVGRALALGGLVLLPGCATLGSLGLGIRPLQFEAARDRPAELRLGTGRGLPTGATLRLWAHVENPNTFGLTLSSIDGTVYLEGSRAASVDFPLGLPLEAGIAQDIPLDVTIRFDELPGLGGVVVQAIGGNPLDYRLEGRFSVDAGPLGRPSFGPSTLLEGEVRAFR
ncbi:MAG TPA: LEA type 2 family protein [Vicinamibacteria bacterium]|nr:LEA type 2 family protein [Vicinamibacteria bacterium]